MSFCLSIPATNARSYSDIIELYVITCLPHRWFLSVALALFMLLIDFRFNVSLTFIYMYRSSSCQPESAYPLTTYLALKPAVYVLVHM